MQYADYGHWQRCWLRDAVLERQLTYWQRQLADLPPVHDFPLDHPRPPRQTYTGKTLYRVLEPGLSDSISSFCRAHDVTLFMLLQTAFAVLVARYSQNDDVVMGTPVAGRTHSDIEDLIGFFVNNLVLRTTVHDDNSFGELLAANKQTILDAYTHQHVPFDMLVDELQPERSLQYGALYQLSFNLVNNEPASMNLADLEMRPLGRQQGLNKYDLQLLADASNEQLVLGLNYNTDLFEPATIAQMADDLVSLLTVALATPAVPLGELPLIRHEHEQQLLELGTGPLETAWRDRRVNQWFAAQARRTPDAPAARGPDGELSYRQLDEISSRLACHLAGRGIGAGERVGIYLQRSAALMVALLGVLKTGAAYVPLDPGNSTGRLRYIIDNAGLGTILSRSDMSPSVPDQRPSVVTLDECFDENWLADHAGASCEYVVPELAEHTAYVIYTSGSTGRPKGVAVSHANLIDYCGFAQEHYYRPELDGSLVVTAHAFDITAPALYLPLLRGGCVELAPPGAELERLAQLITTEQRREDRAYLIRMTPEHIRALLPLLKPGQQAAGEHAFVIGGSALNGDAATELMSHFPRARVYNHYGPTETTIGCVMFELTDSPSTQAPVPIGRPMANTRLYVLDGQRRLLPRGAVGELYVGGAGVSQGYWQDEEKTAASFVADAPPGSESETLYKTGDLVRWLPSGDLIFVGRVDDQVKIRGYRIELGEIESRLNNLPGVAMAAVLAPVGPSGDRQLVAYVVSAETPIPLPEPDHKTRQNRINGYKQALGEVLPDYMVPALFVLLDEMPLTASGKINRRALPAADETAVERGRYVAPANDTEATLCRIWRDLLQLEQVGTEDHFFAIGGHSLLATRLISRVRRELGVELPLRALFEQPTVKGLAGLLAANEQGMVLPPIERVDRSRPLPLSFAQQRLWFIDQLEGTSTQYNMPLSYPLAGEFDRSAFERAVTSIIERHEVLRTNFEQQEGAEQGEGACQLIRDSFELPIRYWDFSDLDVAERQRKATELARVDADMPFDLTRDVMLRMHLVKMDAQMHLMLCNMHHIATDGWSMGVFFRELSALYKAYRTGRENPLPALPIQYADYACWQRGWLRDEVLENQLAYWRSQMHDSPPVHGLPLDRPRPPRQTFAGQTFMRTLEPDLMTSLKALCRQNDATLFMLMQTAFAVTVGRYSNENDIVMGTPIAGRTHGDTEPLIGFFVNSLPLRTRFEPADRFTDVLKVNKQVILDALTHQHIPFEMLVEHIQPERSRQHSPVFQFLFALQNHERTAMDLDELESGQTPIEKMSSRIIKFDLELFAGEEAHGVVMAWRYNTDLFEQSSIERLAASYEQLLKGIVADADQAVAELP
ncbi:MAG: amino acid adenylation domain-containing protein, partial [Wenzhouxiangellaceae bacterium]